VNTDARLGPYEVLSTIGAGGEGEVYRACDTRLSRDVLSKSFRKPF
jgi:eukaryotic-like serine/threonine-protein kinase